ncbi:MAG TPA: Gfo/Idh/MocA family oxidoreductase, partial [Abditibacteriaceae bacterium]
AYVEYENGATGVFITSTGEAPGSSSFEIVGDRGKLTLTGGKLTFHRTTKSVSEFCATNPHGFEKPETWICDVPAWGGSDEHRTIMINWINAIRNGTPLLAKGEEGINGVTLANAMLLSAWTDKWVDLPFNDDLYHRKLKERVKNSTVKKDKASGRTMDVSGTF